MITTCEDQRSEHAAWQGCCHHWEVEIAVAPTSRGRCKLCGAEKEFNNFLSDCLRAENADCLEWDGRHGDDRDAGPDGGTFLRESRVWNSHRSSREALS